MPVFPSNPAQCRGSVIPAKAGIREPTSQTPTSAIATQPGTHLPNLRSAAAGLALWLILASTAAAQCIWPFAYREQRQIEFRDPSCLPHAAMPDIPPPATVSRPAEHLDPLNLSLDDAIRIALERAQVVRFLAGTSASSSGRTIYDTAIANTAIDQAQARFDPNVHVNQAFRRTHEPFDTLIVPPPGAAITGSPVRDYQLDAGVSKVLAGGGTASLDVLANPSHSLGGSAALNPRESSSVQMSLSQPLLQGAGFCVNRAPILVARINTERSYFEYKDSVQGLVQGVIEAYWALVNARVSLWAREQQVTQGEQAVLRAQARQRAGLANVGEVAQSQVAFSGFKANRIAAAGNVLEREAALRNILGLSATSPSPLIPLTPPSAERLAPRWDELLALAEEQRPDIVQLKLIREADEQQRLIACNQALPRLDAVALYRWNGLEGTTPTGPVIGATPGDFADWQMGINFSVPLGLRKERASLREKELIVQRDAIHIDQQVHAAAHSLAAAFRRLDLDYEQYLAFRETRKAAYENLLLQIAENKAGRAIFLNVLQAITDWGNAVTSEAQALTQYNTDLATLERESGTILETHGVRFVEERFGAIGPLGRLGQSVCYPQRLPPTENSSRYPTGDQPSENSFQLQSPLTKPAAKTP